jgi:hypothetical protein
MSNLSLTKELKIYDGEIAASSTKTSEFLIGDLCQVEELPFCSYLAKSF